MRRVILLMAAMAATVLVVSTVAYALSVQCDGAGDQDSVTRQCAGTDENDVITGTDQSELIFALGGLDVVNALGGDDLVDGGRNRDDIFGGVGGDELHGGRGPDDIQGGPGTTAASDPTGSFECDQTLPDASIVHIEGDQSLFGEVGNDDLEGGTDNDLLKDEAGRNVYSGRRGNDCLQLSGDANEQASGNDGDDLIFSVDGNIDLIKCGAGEDSVLADPNDLINGVAASSQTAPIGDCEQVQVV